MSNTDPIRTEGVVKEGVGPRGPTGAPAVGSTGCPCAYLTDQVLAAA